MPKGDFIFTSESVSEGHPDKVSDRISDAVVDAYLTADPHARVERRIGVLENDLNLLPHGAHGLAVQLVQVHALEDDFAGGGALQLQYAAARGGLAAA